MSTIVLNSSLTFATQVVYTGTIYVIESDFDLGTNSVSIPDNCVLQLESKGSKFRSSRLRIGGNKELCLQIGPMLIGKQYVSNRSEYNSSHQ